MFKVIPGLKTQFLVKTFETDTKCMLGGGGVEEKEPVSFIELMISSEAVQSPKLMRQF